MITFLSQPNTIEPSYSNLVFQFSSTAATDTSLYRYRYVVEVYTPEGLISTQKITPSSQGWGQIDLSPILRNYTFSKPINEGCSGSTPLHLSKWGYLENNMLVYTIIVGEEYSTTPTGIVVQYDGEGNVGNPAVRSNVCYTYNGVKEWFNGKNYDFTGYYLTGATGSFPQLSSRFMTNSPRTRWIRESDYSTLAALNWAKQDEDIGSRGVYSALFSFYDNNNNLLSTGRTYNIQEDCGTRPNCTYFDRYWVDSNWYEKQVVYLGVGKPNIEEHGITYPSNVSYYKVQLEGTLSNPNPGTPEIDTFDGCSCHNYSGTSLENDTEIEYIDCQGDLQQLTINEGVEFNFCACQNTARFAFGSGTIVDNGECDACVCRTYRISNSDPDFSYTYTGRSCDDFTSFSGTIEADSTIDVCGCEGSVEGTGGISITLLGNCPLPFSADCRIFDVGLVVAYPVEITYTGCCGDLISFTAQPSTNYTIVANYPFPTSALWGASDLISTTQDCPPPLPPAAPATFGSGSNIICRSVCDNTLWYFSYSGETIQVGQFLNYYDVPMEIIGIGGGGFIPLNEPFIFDTLGQILSAFPCPVVSSGSCLTTTIISEPFYFYVDGKCSNGDRLLYFMNKMGTWDYYNFRAREDVGYGVEKQEYKSSPQLYSEGWDTNTYDGWTSRTNVWNNRVGKSGILYTDYMPQAEMIWLSEELFQSPSVYLITDDNKLEPIIITNTEVVVPNYQVGSSKYQINIEYKSSYDTIRQNHE